MLIISSNYSAAVRLAVSVGHSQLRREHMNEIGGPKVELLRRAGLLKPETMLLYAASASGPIVRAAAGEDLRVVGEWLSSKQVRATDTETIQTQPVPRKERRRQMLALNRRFLDLDRAARHMRELGRESLAEELDAQALADHIESRRIDKELYG